MDHQASRAREVLGLLTVADPEAVVERCSPRIRGWVDAGWSLESHLREVWRPGLEDLVGTRWSISALNEISPTQVRLAVAGERGEGLVTIRFDDDGRVDGFALDREIIDGIANVVINCPDDRVTEMRTFYDALLGEDRWRLPALVFDEGYDYHPPVWGDPSRPQQLHLDVRVPVLAAAEETAVEHGATLRHVAPTHRVYTDPIGHPFCLIPAADRPTALWRIVIDCPEPRDLASFYASLLEMTDVVEESADLIVIARPDGRLPALGFRRVAPYVPPQWPDPAQPAQMHFDLTFDDAGAARARAERLGATLQPTGGSCPVYVDPVGHPHCLCMHGQ